FVFDSLSLDDALPIFLLYHFITQIPASTVNSVPCMYEASCEARNNTALAISVGSPNLLNGMVGIILCTAPSICSGLKPVLLNPFVLIYPGLIPFTRIPFSVNSEAKVLINDCTADFAAE